MKRLKAVALGIKDWLVESPSLWCLAPSAVVTAISQSPKLGHELKPAWLFNGSIPNFYQIPVIRSWRSVPAKIEFHDAKRAGPHLDFRILIDGHVYDFAVVQTDKFPAKTGKVQRVQRTPTHSIKYFNTDKAVFGPGQYGEGTMNTVWRGNLDIIHAGPNKIEFYIPDGQFKGKYFMRELGKGWVLGRMLDPTLNHKDRMEFSSVTKKIESAYDNPNVIAEHKRDGANYLIRFGEKENTVVSRRLSVSGEPINQADKIPQLKYLRMPKELHGIDFHAEVEAEGRSSSTTAGLLNSHPTNSRETQQFLRAPLGLWIWDVEAPGCPYSVRRDVYRTLAASSPRSDMRPLGSIRDRFLFNRSRNPKLFRFPTSNLDTGETPKVFADRLKSEGHEGVVLKDLTKGYYEDVWVKDKKVETLDLKIVGFQEGTGRNAGRVSVLLAKDPRSGAISKIPGLNDFEQEWYHEHRKDVMGETIMVNAHELTTNGITRGPRYVGLHPEVGIVIQNEQGLRDYAKGAGISPYQVKSAAGWRGKR